MTVALSSCFSGSARPSVMAVVNVTPDSFSDGGRLFSKNEPSVDLVVETALQMIADGADIIDIGGESTRPGAQKVSLTQELERVIPVVYALRKHSDIPISVDTSRPEVILEAAKAGANLLNDVRALRVNGALEAFLKTDMSVCLMHMQGEPESMQDDPFYDDVVEDVLRFLLDRAAVCKAAGVSQNRILIDPGFGFGKTLAHNLLLLQQLGRFDESGYPVLVGLSRKSMLAALTGRQVEDRLAGSLALALEAVNRGASIVRVHDVKATVDALKVHQAVKMAGKRHE
ncbi:MAG: dihydropteroate synthase [Pseudomonadales bacterium]|nr:dihydropteroate synthase [Pseudomonadales bacterium]